MSSIQNVQNTASTIAAISNSRPSSSSVGSDTSFATTLANLGNGTSYTDAEVKSFFASKPNAQQIASEAASLGLSEDQIARAMTVGGYGGDNPTDLKKEIENFVATAGSGYAWGANGGLVSLKSTIQAATTSDRAMPSALEIKSFFATNPTETQVTAKAKALGLNAAQLVQFEAAGIGVNTNQISAPVLETMYVDAANRLGTDIGGGKNGRWTSYYAPTLGRAVTKSEMQSFFATNPSQSQIFSKAAELGLGVAAVNNMMIGLGITKPEDMNKAYGKMDFALFEGSDGFSLDQYGHIVAGGGHAYVSSSDGTGSHWDPIPAGSVNKSV